MKLIIVGSGGHAGVVIEACGQEEGVIHGLLDELERTGTEKHGYKVVSIRQTEFPKYTFHVAIGDNGLREEKFKLYEDRLVSIIHPLSMVLRSTVDKGSFVAAGVVICNNCEIGRGAIINTNSSIDHDCAIGDFVHIAPGVTIAGRVKIGQNTFIGMGSCVRDGINIGHHAVIGMGSNVTKDIPDNVVAYGNPCRVVRLCA